MAAETEGIALLSMYNDEEEDEDEEEPPPAPAPSPTLPPEANGVGADEGGGATPTPEQHPNDATPPSPLSRSSLLSEAEPDFKTLRSPTPPRPQPVTQPQTPLAYSFPGRPPTPPPMAAAQISVRESLDAARASRASLTIVDYGHDDVAMSPDHEDGEILSSGQVVVSTELRSSDTNLEDETPAGTVQILMLSTHQASQPSDLPEQSKTESMSAVDFTGAEPEEPHVEEATVVFADMRNDVDPLSNFLPLPPMSKCSEHLQEKVNKFLAYKRAGKSFNVDLRNRKDYRNPDFLQHAVRYQEIDQIGTCFSKDVFDPYGYDKSDYYDEIATGVSAAATSTLLANSAVDSTSRDVRKNRKSKWDKVDDDMKNPLHSGPHDLSTVGVHAAHLSAANAGAGYTAFAQQKRKEAEEKKSTERKSERRS